MSGFPERTLADGRVVMMLPLTFARVRVVIGRDKWIYDDGF